MARDKAAIIKNAQKFTARGQLDKALAEWQKLLDDNPSDGNVHNTVGDLQLRKGDKAGSVSSFFKAANLYKTAGFSLKAMALYKKILNIDPAQLEALTSLGVLNAERGLVGNANENYIAAADIYLKQGNTEQALNVYEKMVELSPSNAIIRAKVADLYIKLGRREKACKEYLACADMLVESGKLEKAETAFRRVKEIMPKHPHAYFGLSRVLKAAGRDAESVEEIRQAQDAVAGDPELEFVYAKAAGEAGLVDEALGALGGVLRNNRLHPEANRLKAEILLKAGRSSEAWEALFPVAEELSGEGKLPDAIAILNPFTEDPIHQKDAYLRLATLYRNAGEQEKAGSVFKKLGALFESAGQSREARRAYTEASQLLPEDEILKEKVAAFAAQEAAETAAPPPQEPEIAPASAAELEPEASGVEDGGFAPEGFGGVETEAPEPEESGFAPAGFAELETEARVAEEDGGFASEGGMDFGFEPGTEGGFSPEGFGAPEEPQPEPPEVEEGGFGSGETFDLDLESPAVEEHEIAPAETEEPGLGGFVLDEEKTVREVLLEVEVFVRYGQFDRAQECLEEVKGKEPENPDIHIWFQRLYAEQGDHEAMIASCVEAARLLDGSGDTERALDALREAATIVPDNERILALREALGDEEISVVGETAAVQEEGEFLGEEPSFGLGVSAEEAGEPGVRPAEAWREGEQEEAGGEESWVGGGVETSVAETAGEGTGFDVDSDMEDATSLEDEFDLSGADLEDEFVGVELSGEGYDEEIEESGAPAGEAGGDLSDYDDDLAEAEFYSQQGLNDEAGKIFERLIGLFPENEQLKEKIRSLGLRVPGEETAPEPEQEQPSPAAVAEPETVGFEPAAEEFEELFESAEEAEEVAEPKFLGEAQEAVGFEEEGEPAFDAEEAASVEPTEAEDVFEPLSVSEEEAESEAEFETLDLFDDEEEEQEVQREKVETDEELAEIFNAFKQGVEKELDEGDYETHYNLGIAYKEMGLLDDAIREFQIVNKSPDLSVDGASMLAICYMEKDLPELAVEQYRTALELVSAKKGGKDADTTKAVRFDLANALERVGETAEALKLFIEVYAVDAKFRNVSARVEALKKSGAAEEAPQQPASKRDRVSYI